MYQGEEERDELPVNMVRTTTKSKKESSALFGWYADKAEKDTSKAADHARWFGQHKPFQNDFENKDKWKHETEIKRNQEHKPKSVYHKSDL